jgi:hypothetical protein
MLLRLFKDGFAKTRMKVVASTVNMSIDEYFGQDVHNARLQKMRMRAVYNVLKVVGLVLFGYNIYHSLFMSGPIPTPLDNALWLPNEQACITTSVQGTPFHSELYIVVNYGWKLGMVLFIVRVL